MKDFGTPKEYYKERELFVSYWDLKTFYRVKSIYC